MKVRWPYDPALALLSAAGLLGGVALGWLTVAPNRLQSGSELMLWQAPPMILAAAVLLAWSLLLAGSWLNDTRVRLFGGALLASALLLGLPALAGAAGAMLLHGAAPTARIQLGAGFWTMTVAAALLLADRLHQLRGLRWLRAAWAVVLIAALAGLAAAGAFAPLALSREYAIQHARFHTALLTHLELVFAAVLLALLIGVPLALVADRRARFGGHLLGVLNLLQTIPSLALFALLIGPLAWLGRQWPWLQAHGVGGIGTAPAVIALVAYALLPIVRSVLAGLAGVPPAAVDAARGMGMSHSQVLRRVRLPLAWPVLLAGLRIVVVQSIGLAAVAALIGAGGLGRFVFLGLGQGAIDLVLLGTLAIIALALLANGLFQSLEALGNTREHGA